MVILFSFRSPIRSATRIIRRFRSEESGTALVETLITLPIFIIFMAGILEFGALLYTKQQVETGLRDASRYLARCPTDPVYGCSANIAINIALNGSPAGGTPRVQDWTAGDITITPAAGLGTPVRVSTDFNYQGSPIIGFLGITSIRITAFHEDRYIGW
jgi:hypothetical protein